MPRPEIVEKLAARLRPLVGDRLREFPLELQLRDGAIHLVLRGAAGSVTALRGLREKVQPPLKTLLRELGAGPRFQTVDTVEGADLVVRIDLP